MQFLPIISNFVGSRFSFLFSIFPMVAAHGINTHFPNQPGPSASTPAEGPGSIFDMSDASAAPESPRPLPYLTPILSKEFIRRCFWCFSASFMAKIPPHFTHISIQTGFVYLLCTSKSLVFLLSLFADTPKTAQHYCPYYSTSRCFRQILFSMQEVSYVRVST